jgi:alpha/beta superfamily hydrolase
MSDILWRFPGNNYTADNGLDTADMETFKKDAISSLARELCQNSVDAKRKDQNFVKLEFKSFEIARGDIPGINDLVKQIEACRDTWVNHKKIKKQLEDMLEQINKPVITCLRISDFNTTGLVGVSGGDNTPWHYLVHGSGISDKGATSGGSKGIGKFATFVNSHFNTVFYSTKTEKGETGFEGICKLCSAKQEGTDEKTQGIGYFGANDRNEPISGEELQLDKSFTRDTYEFGSDIYIIGFKMQDGWKRDIISMILESFMSAVVFETLQIQIDDISLDINSLKDVVYNEDLINKKDRKSIISQYLLLTDKENRYEDVIEVEGYGKADLYLLEFDKEHENLATNGCVMIRYPYMKIKDLQKVSSLPCSAMCIIQDNDLNATLRNVENPQHTDWEFKRIEDKAVQDEVRGIYKDLIEQIRKNIAEHLASSDNTKTDVEGAGDYLPGTTSDSGSNKDKETKVLDTPKIEKKKVKPKETNINASVEDPNGDGIELDIGDTTEDGDDALAPEGHNGGGNGPVKPGPNPAGGKPGEGGNVLVKQAALRGMTYRFFCINKNERKYGVTFTSDFDEEDAYFSLYALDDSGNKYPVEIQNCVINGNAVEVKDNEAKIKLVHGQKMKIELTTDQEELFSGEVKIYAYR